MTRIKVLHDEPYSALLQTLAGESEKVQAILDEHYLPPLVPGTVVEFADIDSRGRATFLRPDETDEPWYLPAGWFEVIE